MFSPNKTNINTHKTKGLVLTQRFASHRQGAFNVLIITKLAKNTGGAEILNQIYILAKSWTTTSRVTSIDSLILKTMQTILSTFLSFAYATLLILLEHWPGFGWIRSAGGIIGFPKGTHRKGAPELTQASWTLMPSFWAPNKSNSVADL